MIAPENVLHRLVETMGTVVSIEIHLGELDRAKGWVAIARAASVLGRADAVFSTWKPDSPMSRMRRGEITLDDAPAELAEVLALCRTARELSDGWFDPWSMPGGVDPTGLVKGWAAAQAARVVREAGAAAAMVNAGGDVATFGEPELGRAWRIGIQDPARRENLVAVAEVRAAIATSGCYERGQHLIDPHTKTPRADVASATVTGPDLAIADALATGMCVAGLDGLGLLSTTGYEGLVVTHDGALVSTESLPVRRRGR